MENITIEDCKFAIITQIEDDVYQVIMPEKLIKELIIKYGKFEVANPLSKRITLKYRVFNDENNDEIKHNKLKSNKLTTTH